MLPSDNCQLKVLDRIYYVNVEDVKLKIRNGTVLRQDQIKIGNTSWKVIECIPEFEEMFKEFEAKNKLPENFDGTHIFTNFQVPETNYTVISDTPQELDKCCAIHSESQPFYVCTVCENLFCKDCPTITEDAKICPFCGGKCVLYLGQMWKFEERSKTKYDIKKEKKETVAEKEPEYIYTKLRKEDFFKAFIYPLKSPFALLIGGILCSILVVGQIVSAFKGGWMLLVSIFITALILMLKFGVLSRCFENFSQNTFKTGYMPRIKKFAVFEDFVHPFFMGIKAYFVAFGLFTVLALVLLGYAWFSFTETANSIENEMIKTENQMNATLYNNSEDKKARENELRKMLNEARLEQIEAVFGSNHLVENRQIEKAVKSVSRLTVYLQMPVVFAFILGVLFFPAVCLTIGRNHLLSLKQRFIYALKEIKKIGFDYLKILFMCFVLITVSALAMFGFNFLFSYFELPIAGILSAVIAGSFLIFYFWTVFSTILAITITDRNSDLDISRNPI